MVENLIDSLDEIETETDNQQTSLQEQLFLMEDDLPPIEVMFLYRLIDMVGGIADYAERIGRRLEILLAK